MSLQGQELGTTYKYTGEQANPDAANVIKGKWVKEVKFGVESGRGSF